MVFILLIVKNFIHLIDCIACSITMTDYADYKRNKKEMHVCMVKYNFKKTILEKLSSIFNISLTRKYMSSKWHRNCVLLQVISFQSCNKNKINDTISNVICCKISKQTAFNGVTHISKKSHDMTLANAYHWFQVISFMNINIVVINNENVPVLIVYLLSVACYKIFHQFHQFK